METPSEVDLLLSVSRPSPPRGDHGPPKRRRSQRRPKTKPVADDASRGGRQRGPRRRGGTRARAAGAPPAGVGGIAWAPPAMPSGACDACDARATAAARAAPEAVDQDALAAAMRLRPRPFFGFDALDAYGGRRAHDLADGGATLDG